MCKVSVIIPTRNSQKYLKEVLQSVESQSARALEVIVVDNYSSDSTRSIASERGVSFYQCGPERSTQKNFGALKATGNFLLFLDSDAVLSDNVIKECVEACENNKYQMVIIPEKHIGEGFWAKAKALERECYLGDDTIECPWFFNREVFLYVGGYNEAMISGEDWDLFNRLKSQGYKYCRNSSFIYHQLGNLSFWQYVKKKQYYGKNIRNFISNNKNDSIKKIPFFRLAYVRNWKKLLRHPDLTIGFILLKVFESLFILGGILSKNE